MARVEKSAQAIVRTGLNPAYTAVVAGAANGIAFDNSSAGPVLHVKNGGGGAVAVTIETPGSIDGLAIPDLSVSVPAGEDRIIGPFPKALYNQVEPDTALNEAVVVTFDIDTSVTVAVLSPGSVSY